MEARTFQKIRKHSRVSIKTLVKVKTGRDFPFCMSKNLSEGGIFLVVKQPPRKGTKLILEFTIPDTAAPISVEGEIVSSLPYDPAQGEGSHYGMGVKFTSIKDEDKKTIRAYVERHAAASDREKPTKIPLPSP